MFFGILNVVNTILFSLFISYDNINVIIII